MRKTGSHFFASGSGGALTLQNPSDRSWLRSALAGLSATLVGIGFARFAYGPLLPALIEEGWFTASQAAYLGAANLAGYLAGAWLGWPIARRLGAATALRTMMVVSAATFLACAAPQPFILFFLWRFTSGFSGGLLVVVAAPTALRGATAERRGLASGIIFTGVGLGIATSGLLTPLLLKVGLAETWIAFSALSLLLARLSWSSWPEGEAAPPVAKAAPAPPALRMLYIAYALVAVGLTPHMIFLVDFVARGLGRGIDIGSLFWILFGLGALAGPMLSGLVADRFGFHKSLLTALLMMIACLVWIALAPATPALILSSLVIGAFVPGITSLVLGRLHDLVSDAAARQAAWSDATVFFAIGQAVAAYGMSFVFASTDGAYRPLFAIAAGAAVLALLCMIQVGRMTSRSGKDPNPR